MTIRVTVVSDLHLDIGGEFPIMAGGDVLVLAGDTCEGHHIKKFLPDPHGLLSPGFKIINNDRINGWLNNECAAKYEHVIMIAGNHEHYRGVFDHTIAKMKENVPDNFRVLEKEVFEVGDVLFIGATLWTDMNRDDPMTRMAIKNGMNDFQCVRKIYNRVLETNVGDYGRFTPEIAVQDHRRALQFIKMALDNPGTVGKKVVVVTHHAPSSLSIDDRFKGDFLMNGGYHSRLEEFILDNQQIGHWFHGHMHHAKDYQIGNTRIVCNPRGYHAQGYNEYTGWDPNLTFDI